MGGNPGGHSGVGGVDFSDKGVAHQTPGGLSGLPSSSVFFEGSWRVP